MMHVKIYHSIRRRRLAFFFAALIAGLNLSPVFGQQQRPRRVGANEQQQSQPTVTPNAAEDVDDGETVRVETQLVSVPVSVTDRGGRMIGKLRAEDFSLYEDGRLQQITNFMTTDAPFEVALLLDTSGSTRAQLALIRRAANAFLAALRPGDRVSIVAFHTAEEEGNKLAAVEVKTKLTSDRDELRQAVESIGASSGTPFYDALARTVDEVFKEPAAPEMSGRRALVALTDGVDSTSDSDYVEARAALIRAGIACYFVQVSTEDFVEERLMRDCEDDGTLQLSRAQLKRYRKIYAPRADAGDYQDFCRMGPFQRMQISRDLYNLARREMADLARVSGGSITVADDLNEARRAFAQVAANIGTQFSLGYYPTNKARDGRYRAIRVEVKDAAQRGGAAAGGAPLTVRAREGYYAPKG
ncbi:MAG TPA: VWA domain-containing protein [Pyrinomonadaceae bacterium]|jgi:VWFA-related protein|nr:VWA domain-containing protein [Pyrinomonadaceae bacterium]